MKSHVHAFLHPRQILELVLILPPCESTTTQQLINENLGCVHSAALEADSCVTTTVLLYSTKLV